MPDWDVHAWEMVVHKLGWSVTTSGIDRPETAGEDSDLL